MAKRVVGLDFGRATIRAVEVENPDKAHPVVVRYAEVPVPDGAIRSGEVREALTVTAAIRRLWTVGGFSSKDVVLGMANQRVLVRDLTVPQASMQQIKESLPFLVQDMLPVPVADAVLDFYPVSEGEGDQGPVVNGLLIAAIKESVLVNIEAVREAGLNPVDVDLVPFAISRVQSRGEHVAGTVVLIDIGASTTNIVVTSSGVPIFVRMVPFGGQGLTDALSTRLEIAEDQAELLKRARGLSSDPATSELDYKSIEIIRGSALELLGSIRNTLHFFSSSRPTQAVESIVLSGGGSKLSGLTTALGQMLGIPVVLADTFSTVEVAKSVKTEGADPAGMLVALGLAMGSAA
jgi:type IV pilus assembly protein PilM